MAKKINNSEETKDEIVEKTSIPQSDINYDKDTENTQMAAPITTIIPKHIEGIFKKYMGHESLFIDAQGGVYTSDTPKAIRGNSVLYQNPFTNNKIKS